MRALGLIGVVGIWLYRLFVRPFLRRCCLYQESCSAYGIRMFRTHGLVSALPHIRARVRSCRLPATACFVLDDHGARLLSATGHDGMPPPELALALVASRARGAR